MIINNINLSTKLTNLQESLVEYERAYKKETINLVRKQSLFGALNQIKGQIELIESLIN